MVRRETDRPINRKNPRILENVEDPSRKVGSREVLSDQIDRAVTRKLLCKLHLRLRARSSVKFAPGPRLVPRNREVESSSHEESEEASDERAETLGRKAADREFSETKLGAWFG